MHDAHLHRILASFVIQATKGQPEFLLDLGEHGDEALLPVGFLTLAIDHGTTS